MGTHRPTLHLLWPPDKHTTALPFRFLPKLAGCSELCRDGGFNGRAWDERRAIGEFDRHQAIRYTVIGVERRLLQAERGSALL
jgi:hypothetical protein